MTAHLESGNRFRDQIAELLSAKFRTVRSEVALTGKKADIYFAEPIFPNGTRKIAVECKAWNSRALTSGHIARIRSEYDPAFKANEIDALWIVVGRPVEAFPKKSASPYGPALQVFTFQELQNSMMNFSEYLNYLIGDFESNGLSSYYIDTFTDQGQNFHDEIVAPWLKKLEGRPVALFGGYGMGKSSYAKRLAAYLADKVLEDSRQRIPILIRLGGLTQAQSIRDLVTVQFAAEHHVDGFTYNLFSKLNSLGRFVLIFDGFDEMKHAMKRRDIEANLVNITAFVSPISKVILLGRPDPLTSLEDELFLDGKNVLASGDAFSDPTRPEFDSYNIAIFREVEAYEFIDKYIRWHVEHNIRNLAYDSEFVMRRLKELHQISPVELIRRPVHAKILADLALIPDQNIRINSEYELYHEFIFRIEVRETSEKRARAPIDAKTRIDFMLDIGWWLWSRKKADSFSILEIPDDIAGKWIERFEDVVDRETALRELLIGSVFERSRIGKVIETKDDVRFFFPHRSYWEFLIAEYLARQRFVVDGVLVAEAMSNRVDEFIRQRTDRVFMTNIGQHFERFDARVRLEFMVRFSSFQDQGDIEQFAAWVKKGYPEASSLDVVMHVISCARTSGKNWGMVDECISTMLFRGSISFDCAFLATLSWVTIAGLVSLDDICVMTSWRRIAGLCVLKTYDDWLDKVDPGVLGPWLKKGRFPHAKTLIQRMTLRHHNVIGSPAYAAGMTFGKAVLFKRRILLEKESLIKFNVAFVSGILGPAVKGVIDFGPEAVETGKYIVDVDVRTTGADIGLEKEMRKLRRIVERGKWAIDLSIKPSEG